MTGRPGAALAIGAGLLLATFHLAAAQSRSGPRWIISAGLNHGVKYHAPISSTGRTGGRSFGIGFGPNPRPFVVVPRIALSYHAAFSDSSSLDMVRLEGNAVIGLVRSRRILPYLGAGLGAHTSWYDRCDAPGLPAPGDPGPCTGRNTRLGWQGTVGVHFPAQTGAAASVSVQYMSNPKAFDGLVFLLSLSL